MAKILVKIYNSNEQTRTELVDLKIFNKFDPDKQTLGEFKALFEDEIKNEIDIYLSKNKYKAVEYSILLDLFKERIQILIAFDRCAA